jgi:hypothetical protein
MKIEDINKECKELSKKQSYIKKGLENFLNQINNELDISNADISLHIRLSAWEMHPNYQYDDTGEFGNNYYLVLENGEFKLQLGNTEYYNMTGTHVYEDIDIQDITPPKARDILIELPEALTVIKTKLQELNKKYERALS